MPNPSMAVIMTILLLAKSLYQNILKIKWPPSHSHSKISARLKNDVPQIDHKEKIKLMHATLPEGHVFSRL